MNFQDVILNLQRYWADQGCVLQQPVDQETGAGTLNPATFLRVLGPEPWRVAYAEPCRRPTDGRYAENPYRLGAYYQFQVILKPSPKNVLDLYLGSLRQLGIDPLEHDIRFVEDDWEQPTLGAWGLGWEIWADGMEVTQFTYFQQAGQVDLNPVCAEITYGLERICMYLQSCDNVFDLDWVEGVKYGEVHTQSELEYSEYCFKAADAGMLSSHLDDYEAQALHLFEAGLVLPGYDFVLKANHAFNVLDARGAISVTERQKYIGRIRKLSRAAATAFLSKREAMGFPMLKQTPVVGVAPPQVEAGALTGRQVFLEIGAEEIPASFIGPALDWMADALVERLGAARLSFGAVQTRGTPRRLAVWVDDVDPAQEDTEEEVLGPPARVAFDAEGKPTRAAEGFAAKLGVGLDALTRKTTDRGDYLAATLRHKGQPTLEILPTILSEIVAGIPFRKSMRWGHEAVSFARPVHWICALYGGQIVPMAFGDVQSGDRTFGHRFMSPGPIKVVDASQWVRDLLAAHVEVDIDARRQMIRVGLSEMSAEAGGLAVPDPELVAEVANLVEMPLGQLGRFHEDNLKLPPEVLISAMRKHQRYFAFQDADGRLLPCFGVFNNTKVKDPAVVVHGHERVLQARLYDARFFFREDRERPLEDRLEILDRVRFLGGLEKIGVGDDLGSRTRRLQALTERIVAVVYPGDAAILAAAQRAAKLSKADLATLMVGEFPDLQGTIGAYYAEADGEPAAVAQAIGEQYRPRGASDGTARSPAGICLALADKLELMAACYAIGLIPTGNKDPYGLRRAALGVLRTLDEASLDVDLRIMVKAAVAVVRGEHEAAAAIVEEIMAFFGGRLRAELVDGHRTDIVDAVMAAGFDRPMDARRRVDALDAIAQQADLAPLGEAFKRINNILQKNAEAVDAKVSFQEDRVVQEEERTLGQLALELDTTMRQQLDAGDYHAALGHLVRLQKPLDDFFTEVMVMHEDPALRANRLALLSGLRRTFETVADVSRIQVRAS